MWHRSFVTYHDRVLIKKQLIRHSLPYDKACATVEWFGGQHTDINFHRVELLAMDETHTIRNFQKSFKVSTARFLYSLVS